MNGKEKYEKLFMLMWDIEYFYQIEKEESEDTYEKLYNGKFLMIWEDIRGALCKIFQKHQFKEAYSYWQECELLREENDG